MGALLPRARASSSPGVAGVPGHGSFCLLVLTVPKQRWGAGAACALWHRAQHARLRVLMRGHTCPWSHRNWCAAEQGHATRGGEHAGERGCARPTLGPRAVLHGDTRCHAGSCLTVREARFALARGDVRLHAVTPGHEDARGAAPGRARPQTGTRAPGPAWARPLRMCR